jgi:hypothetical protein
MVIRISVQKKLFAFPSRKMLIKARVTLAYLAALCASRLSERQGIKSCIQTSIMK